MTSETTSQSGATRAKKKNDFVREFPYYSICHEELHARWLVRRYLAELTRECEAKAKEWDQEASMRGNELKALRAPVGEDRRREQECIRQS